MVVWHIRRGQAGRYSMKSMEVKVTWGNWNKGLPTVKVL